MKELRCPICREVTGPHRYGTWPWTMTHCCIRLEGAVKKEVINGWQELYAKAEKAWGVTG